MGIIICGYQGIGKSTASKLCNKIIDLESGAFWQDGKRQNDWYEIYSKIALHLAEQDYIVCVSSHQVVRDYLTSLPLPENVHIYCCYPSIELKDEWLDKLVSRYRATLLVKDYKAAMNAIEMYENNIHSLQNQINCGKIILSDMNYDLVSELLEVYNQYE